MYNFGSWRFILLLLFIVIVSKYLSLIGLTPLKFAKLLLKYILFLLGAFGIGLTIFLFSLL